MWLEEACTVLQGINCSLGVHESGLLWVIFQVLKFRRHRFIYVLFLFIYLFLPPALTHTSKMIRSVLKALMYQRLSQNLEFKLYLGIQLSKAGSQRATPPFFVCVLKKNECFLIIVPDPRQLQGSGSSPSLPWQVSNVTR